MDASTNLATLGLTLPTSAYLVGSVVFGFAGYLAYRRGRTSSRLELTLAGVALMVYPYAVSETWTLWAIGVALCGCLYVKWD